MDNITNKHINLHRNNLRKVNLINTFFLLKPRKIFFEVYLTYQFDRVCKAEFI